jgi:hypothetical protein
LVYPEAFIDRFGLLSLHNPILARLAATTSSRFFLIGHNHFVTPGWIESGEINALLSYPRLTVSTAFAIKWSYGPTFVLHQGRFLLRFPYDNDIWRNEGRKYQPHNQNLEISWVIVV